MPFKLGEPMMQAVEFGAAASALAYATLRLFSVWSGEPNPLAIGPSEHIPYFWRCIVSTWIGASAGTFVGWFQPFSGAAWSGVQRALGVAVGVSIVVLVAFP